MARTSTRRALAIGACALVAVGASLYLRCARSLPFSRTNSPTEADVSGEVLDVYSTALIQATNEMASQYDGMNVGLPGEPRIFDFKRVLVCTNESVTAEYPSAVGERRFEYLSSAALFARRSKVQQDLPVLVVTPARLERNRIKVLVEHRWVSSRDGKPALLVSDWAEVYFRFDTEKGTVVFDKVKLGGI